MAADVKSPFVDTHSFRVVDKEHSERIYKQLVELEEFELLLKRDMYEFAAQSGVELYGDLAEIAESVRANSGLRAHTTQDAAGQVSTHVVLRQGSARADIPPGTRFPQNYFHHVSKIFLTELKSRSLTPDDYDFRVPTHSTKELQSENRIIKVFLRSVAFNHLRVTRSIDLILAEIAKRR